MLRTAVGRVGAALVRHALVTTANYLEETSPRVIDQWIGRLQATMPSYAPLVREMRAWGTSNLALLVSLLRADRPADREKIQAQFLGAGREMASIHLERGIPLYEILRAASLFRLSVLNGVERMLRSRLWIAFPQDILRAEDIINETLDHQMLLTSESYLAERDRIIARSQAELESANRQLKVLVQEMHHRIKNNLQTIADLLTLEIHSDRQIPTQTALRESIARVRSIAAVHELLSAENVREADIKELAELIVASCVKSMTGSDSRDPVRVRVEGQAMFLPSKQATAMALVMTELVNNALEHAFIGKGGTLVLSIADRGAQVTVTVRDDGEGLPSGFDIDVNAKLGLQIVRTLVNKDLNGTLELLSNGGTTATVRFAK
jgi:two-component sensor histidine kinase